MTGLEIKEIRSSLGLSQEAFAHLIGVSFGTINRWERMVCKPSRLAIEKIRSLGKNKERKDGR